MPVLSLLLRFVTMHSRGVFSTKRSALKRLRSYLSSIEFTVFNIEPRYSKAGESCARHVPSKRVHFLLMNVFGNLPRRRKVLQGCVRLAGDPSCVCERNAKCRKARVWYLCGTGELNHLGSTGWLVEARSKRTSHFQIFLELPVWRGKYSRKGSILPAASMHVPLMSWVDAIFWLTRQTLSRNDSLRAGTCLRRVHMHWRQCNHRRGDIDVDGIHHE